MPSSIDSASDDSASDDSAPVSPAGHRPLLCPWLLRQVMRKTRCEASVCEDVAKTLVAGVFTRRSISAERNVIEKKCEKAKGHLDDLNLTIVEETSLLRIGDKAIRDIAKMLRLTADASQSMSEAFTQTCSIWKCLADEVRTWESLTDGVLGSNVAETIDTLVRTGAGLHLPADPAITARVTNAIYGIVMDRVNLHRQRLIDMHARRLSKLGIFNSEGDFVSDLLMKARNQFWSFANWGQEKPEFGWLYKVSLNMMNEPDPEDETIPIDGLVNGTDGEAGTIKDYLPDPKPGPETILINEVDEQQKQKTEERLKPWLSYFRAKEDALLAEEAAIRAEEEAMRAYPWRLGVKNPLDFQAFLLNKYEQKDASGRWNGERIGKIQGRGKGQVYKGIIIAEELLKTYFPPQYREIADKRQQLWGEFQQLREDI